MEKTSIFAGLLVISLVVLSVCILIFAINCNCDEYITPSYSGYGYGNTNIASDYSSLPYITIFAVEQEFHSNITVSFDNDSYFLPVFNVTHIEWYDNDIHEIKYILMSFYGCENKRHTRSSVYLFGEANYYYYERIPGVLDVQFVEYW